MEVKPYVLLGCIDVYEDYRVDLPRDQIAKTLDELICPLRSKPHGLYRHRGYLGFTHDKSLAGSKDADPFILTRSARCIFGGFLLEYGAAAYPSPSYDNQRAAHQAGLWEIGRRPEDPLVQDSLSSPRTSPQRQGS